jgi:hypothetical protein
LAGSDQPRNEGGALQAVAGVDKPRCPILARAKVKVPPEGAVKREAGENPALCPQL